MKMSKNNDRLRYVRYKKSYPNHEMSRASRLWIYSSLLMLKLLFHKEKQWFCFLIDHILSVVDKKCIQRWPVSSAAANSYTEACTPSWQSASIGTEKTSARLQPSSSKVSLFNISMCLSLSLEMKWSVGKNYTKLTHYHVTSCAKLLKLCHFPRRIWHKEKIPLTSFPKWASLFLLPAASTPQWLVLRLSLLPCCLPLFCLCTKSCFYDRCCCMC